MSTEIAQSSDKWWQRAWSRWGSLRPTTRWGGYALLIGYLPLFAVGFLPFNRDELAGFGLAWGIWITIPCTLIVAAVLLFEVVRLFAQGSARRRK